jgi:hypothetical protein
MEKKTPKWIEIKNAIKHDEQIEFVGQLGADGVIDGKLPNGEDYEWSKKDRKQKRKLKKPK